MIGERRDDACLSMWRRCGSGPLAHGLFRYASAIDDPDGEKKLAKLLADEAEFAIHAADGTTLRSLSGRGQIVKHFFSGRDRGAAPRRHYVYLPSVDSFGRELTGQARFVSVEHPAVGDPAVLAAGTYHARFVWTQFRFRLRSLSIDLLGESAPFRQ